MTTDIDVSVLVVNYKTPHLTKMCIESILMQRGVQLEIIVVDNHSQDQSVALLQEKFGEQITLIANQDNLGFGKANNQAFSLSRGHYIFMLNPDASFLTPHDLVNAIQFLTAHPEIGLAGTRVINAQGAVETTTFLHYPKQRQSTINFSILPGHLSCVLGASMVTTREAFLKVNGFDEDYFLYSEETDLCLRLRKQGYHIGYCETVTVQHEGGASEALLPSAQTIRRKQSGKYLFYCKHYSPQDVLNIARNDFKHARWNLFLLTLKKRLLGLSLKQQAKVVRHQITCDIAGAHL